MAESIRVEDTSAVHPRSPATDVALSVAEAAARVGLTAATLRTWHRRYGLAPSVRTLGGHRRYNGTDVARLRRAGQMVDGGVPASEAVAACLELSDEAVVAPDQVPSPRGPGRAGGGRVVPLPDGDDVQRGLARAAMSLDGPAITATVSALLTDHGVVETWERVLVPVLVAIGRRWDQTKRGVEIEHVLAGAIADALIGHGGTVVADRRPVLLACVPEEQHSLPLLALHAALRERDEPSVLLGSRVPIAALHDAIRRIRPRRLVLWAQLSDLADTAALRDLPAQRPPLTVVLAGPGWAQSRPDDLDYPQTLQEALDLLAPAA